MIILYIFRLISLLWGYYTRENTQRQANAKMEQIFLNLNP